MQKLRYGLIGFGFFWHFLWSVSGSLLGARIHSIVQNPVQLAWLHSTQKSLLTAAHAHMNTMAFTTILFGITLPYVRGALSPIWINRCCAALVASLPLFGGGLVWQAFCAPDDTLATVAVVLTSSGGALYLLAVLCWSSLFFVSLSPHFENNDP